jgi:hypothetical protein
VNFVFVAIVIRALLRSTTMLTKSKRQQAKSIVKAICVMSPVLGLTWVFGVMGVNEQTVVFLVLFVVFNSLQVCILLLGWLLRFFFLILFWLLLYAHAHRSM